MKDGVKSQIQRLIILFLTTTVFMALELIMLFGLMQETLVIGVGLPKEVSLPFLFTKEQSMDLEQTTPYGNIPFVVVVDGEKLRHHP